mgnify:CR=1 FL=1
MKSIPLSVGLHRKVLHAGHHAVVKRRHLGYFATKEEAGMAYQSASHAAAAL